MDGEGFTLFKKDIPFKNGNVCSFRIVVTFIHDLAFIFKSLVRQFQNSYFVFVKIYFFTTKIQAYLFIFFFMSRIKGTKRFKKNNNFAQFGLKVDKHFFKLQEL